MKVLQMGVIGSAGPEEYAYRKPIARMELAAEEIGYQLAQHGCMTVTGGKGGVMIAASRGAKRGGGITIAETSGVQRFTSNAYVDVEVITGDRAFRGPSQLVAMSDAVICLGGGAGTLQELCVAYRMQKPIILVPGYGGWTDRLAGRKWLDERRLIEFCIEPDPAKAVRLAINLVQSTSKEDV